MMVHTKASPTTSNSILKLLSELPEHDLLIYLDGEIKSVENDRNDLDTSYQNDIKQQYQLIMDKTPHQTIFNYGTPQDMTTQFADIMAKTFKTFKYNRNI